MRKVAVVILNYKVKDLALKCVWSVQKSSYHDTEIILVDNNSNDGLEEQAKKIAGIVFIQTGKNLGYGGGNNVGIKKGLSKKSDFIFILNPDATLDKDAISNLVRDCQKFRADILGPKIYFEDRKTLWYAGGIFDKDNVLGKHRGVDEKDLKQYNKALETDFVSGAAMFVKSDVFKKIGFFDERYFLYYEDSDFCLRAKKQGLRIIYAPNACVYHANAKSTGLGSLLQDYFITRNRLLYASKFLSFKTRFALLREAIKNFSNSSKRLAVFDYLKGNFGKGSFKV